MGWGQGEQEGALGQAMGTALSQEDEVSLPPDPQESGGREGRVAAPRKIKVLFPKEGT